MFSAAIIGTERNIPGIPQIKPHRSKDNKIANIFKFNLLPKIIGSTKLPEINWIADMKIEVKKAQRKLSN
jgi:hypothetical protein